MLCSWSPCRFLGLLLCASLTLVGTVRLIAIDYIVTGHHLALVIACRLARGCSALVPLNTLTALYGTAALLSSAQMSA